MHNKPGGGQGEDAAIKGGVPGADTVLHKGQLRGGKLLAVQGFVGIKIEPLAQPQLQDQVVLCTAVAVHDGCGGILQKGGGIRRVAEPLAAHAGVCRRAKAQIVAAVPVDEVVTAFIARLCKVGDLVLAVAVVFQLLHGVEVEISGFIAGGALMGVVSALLKFGGIEVSIADSWWVNPMSEVCSLLAYICLIGFFIRATKK